MGVAQGHVAEVNVLAMSALQGLSEPTNESANANASFSCLVQTDVLLTTYHPVLFPDCARTSVPLMAGELFRESAGGTPPASKGNSLQRQLPPMNRHREYTLRPNRDIPTLKHMFKINAFMKDSMSLVRDIVC